MALELSMSLIASPLTRPVLSGQAPVEGAVVHAEQAESVNTNSLRMLNLDFDVAEMSLATFTHAREQAVPLVALPVFTGRRFLQGGIQLSAAAGITDLAQLRGRNVGLPQFWMTSSVWHRLVLRQVHRVAQNEVHWVTNAPERMGTLGLPPEAHQDTSGRNPRDLLLAGEIDAIMGAGAGGPRGDGGGEGDDRIVRAHHDPVAAQRDYYQQTGVFPIMHMIVMKEELATREPWLVQSLCDAFEQAKEVGARPALEDGQYGPIPGLAVDETKRLFGEDPWPYGIEPNRKVLQTFLDDVRDQGLIHRPMAPEELFPRGLPVAYQ